MTDPFDKPLSESDRNRTVSVKVTDSATGNQVNIDVQTHKVLGALKRRYDYLEEIKEKLAT